MVAPVNLVGGGGKTRAVVSQFGQLITAPLSFSQAISVDLDTPSTVFNLVKPKHKHTIIVTDIILSTGKDVGVNGANITVYAADTAEDLQTADNAKTIFRTEIVKNVFAPLTGLNLGIRQGRFISVTTSAAVVFSTIMFYFAEGEL